MSGTEFSEIRSASKAGIARLGSLRYLSTSCRSDLDRTIRVRREEVGLSPPPPEEEEEGLVVLDRDLVELEGLIPIGVSSRRMLPLFQPTPSTRKTSIYC